MGARKFCVWCCWFVAALCGVCERCGALVPYPNTEPDRRTVYDDWQPITVIKEGTENE